MFLQGLARYLTLEQREKLATVRVGIAGAGGLGSNCAMLLARSGIRKFVIADCDFVDASNLNRQFFFADQIGQNKVHALKANIHALDSAIDIVCHTTLLDAANVSTIFSSCDIIVEALDSIESKRMMAQIFLPDDPLLVSASGMAGWGGESMRVRKIRNDMVIVGDFSRDIATHPPLAPRVMMAAAMQADAVLEYVLGPCVG